MIGVILQQGSAIYKIVVDGNSLTFNDGSKEAPFENIALSKSGVLKEFPELAGRDDWRLEAVKRFKQKLNSYKTEEEKVEYIVNDLRRYGYVPKYKQKKGFRVEAIK